MSLRPVILPPKIIFPLPPILGTWKIFEKFPDPGTLYRNQNFRTPLLPTLILGTWKIFEKFPAGSLSHDPLKKNVENMKE